MLVGGGELHDRWSSLVGVVVAALGAASSASPGSRRRWSTARRRPRRCCPSSARLLRGRVLVAHTARFDVGVLRGAFARAALDWPDPPVLCTVAMARRLAPLQRRRGLAALADALGIEVEVTHRALPDAETCARVFCALFGRLVRARGDDRRGGRAARARAAGAPAAGARAPGARRRPPAERPGLLGAAAATPASTCSATPTGARSTSASRSACAPARARTSRRRRPGPARPSTSTTRRRSPSSARCCSRTG